MARATIRPVRDSDWAEWLRVRLALWPGPAAAHEDEMRVLSVSRDVAVFVAERDGGGLCGFAEFAVRPFADGCDTRPVAYLEGWYVDPDARRAGVGRRLVEAGEDWARARGLREMGSDAALDNEASRRAHAALGFSEAGRAVLYGKRL